MKDISEGTTVLAAALDSPRYDAVTAVIVNITVVRFVTPCQKRRQAPAMPTACRHMTGVRNNKVKYLIRREIDFAPSRLLRYFPFIHLRVTFFLSYFFQPQNTLFMYNGLVRPGENKD